MSEADFWDCTPQFFMMRRRAWLQNRQGMEEARFVAFYMLKTVDAKNKIRRLTDVCRFPWEKRAKIKWEPWNEEEMQQYSDAADRALEIMNPQAYERYMSGKKQRENMEQMQFSADILPQGGLSI